MMKWYYQHKNKMYGPIDQNFLVDLLMIGEIEKSTLCCADGSTEWRSFVDFIDLRNSLKTSYIRLSKTPQECVLLVKNSDPNSGQNANQWLQQGPFDYEQVCEMLRDGRVSKMDRIWMEGFTTWVPLFKIAHFRTDVLILDSSSRLDLSNVIELI